MCDPLSHGLLASAGVARANSAMMGSGNPAFTHDLRAPVSRGRESSRTPAPSRFTAAGTERPHGLNGSHSGVEMLLLEQNQLLMQQLAALQSQVQRSQAHFEAVSAKEASQSKLFQTHTKLLEGVDPALQKLFEEFEKEAKHVFEAWETQKKLLEKYLKLKEDGRFHNHLQSEADFRWQWTKLYLAKPQPISADQGMMGVPYSVAEEWARMRRKHAEECFDFVCKHQQQCVAIYEHEVSLPVLKQRLQDRLDAWFAEQAYDDMELREALKQRASQFVDSIIRATRPKIQTRMAKDKDLQQKREQALLEAKSKWEEMDVKDVLSPALFELLDAKQKRSFNIKEDSALAFLVKDNEELCKKHKVKIVSETSRSSRRAPTPKKAPRKDRGRSPKKSSDTPRSILKSSSRSPSKHSRSPSGRSGSSKHVRFEAKGGVKGKGKAHGKGKGKGKQKRK